MVKKKLPKSDGTTTVGTQQGDTIIVEAGGLNGDNWIGTISKVWNQFLYPLIHEIFRRSLKDASKKLLMNTVTNLDWLTTKQFLPNMPITKITTLLDGVKLIKNGCVTRVSLVVLPEGMIKIT